MSNKTIEYENSLKNAFILPIIDSIQLGLQTTYHGGDEVSFVSKQGMVCWLAVLVALMLPPGVGAANPANINVTVTVQSLSVSASGPIAFGTVTAGSATVAGDSSHVVNDGNISETYSINLSNPGGWTAVQAAPGAEEYVLSVMFNATAPLVGDFTYADHALTTSSVASSGTQFAGDQTGLAIAASGIRYLWFKFEAPSSTVVTAEQTIVITITAAAS